MLKNNNNYMVSKKKKKKGNLLFKKIFCRKHYTINDYFMNKEQHLVETL